jgi:hypothetical protein
MTAARRWWCVAVLVLLVIATPVLVRALPASDERVSAAALLARVRYDLPHTGYVETAGHVALPVDEEPNGLGSLLGEENRLRVWWQDRRTWRVATLRTTGETDVLHAGDRMLRWVYESRDVVVTPDPRVRFPNTVDLLPNELARRVLEDARPDELSRLPARRVAGRDALGLRLRPAQEQSAIRRVDVYVDRVTGLPLHVELFARGDSNPALSTQLRDVSFERPDPSTLAFEPPMGVRVDYDEIIDLASAADRFAARQPPGRLAGLPARHETDGSVGVYGRGPTVLLAVPLWSRTSARVRLDLRGRPGVRQVDEGLLVEAPPLRMLLGEPELSGSSWLLAGTVTRGTLLDAAEEIAADPPELRFP